MFHKFSSEGHMKIYLQVGNYWSMRYQISNLIKEVTQPSLYLVSSQYLNKVERIDIDMICLQECFILQLLLEMEIDWPVSWIYWVHAADKIYYNRHNLHQNDCVQDIICRRGDWKQRLSVMKLDELL